MKTSDIKLKSADGKQELPLVSSFSRQLAFAVGSHGVFSSGKSRLGVTGPPLTFILPLDSKTRRTVEKVMREMDKQFGRDILMPPEDFLEPINPMQAARLDKSESIILYRKRVERCKEYLIAAHDNPRVQLVVMDTASQLYEEMCYASYGREGYKVKKIGDEPYKDKSDANQEMIDLIRLLKSKPLLLVHTSKDEYIKGKNKPIGLTLEGMKNAGYQCEVVVQHEYNKQFDGEDGENNWRFALSVQTCQDRVELQGPEGKRLLVDDMITMGGLMNQVFPEQDWSDWL